MNERLNGLICYLYALIELKKTDYKVYDEIQRVLNEINAELGIKNNRE